MNEPSADWTRRAAIFFIPVAILGLAAVLRSQAVDPHNSGCPACHRGVPKPGLPLLSLDINRVCTDCHAQSKSPSHPVGMVPSMAVPDDLHLDARGRVTCVTCHDIHQQGSGHAPYAALLRRPQAGRPFCTACHRSVATPNPTMLHSLVEASAHGRSRLVRADSATPGFLDSISRQCLGCHDGSVATGGETMSGGGLFDHGGEVGITHPIGIDYRAKALTNRALVPMVELDPAVRLFGGMVGCASCHDPFSNAKHQLVMDNAGSRLCLQCHRM
jgi:predicted CXXCH cytochrome family protein